MMKLFAGLIVLLMTSCVTTTTSDLTKEKDLSKAESAYVEIGYRQAQQNSFQQAKVSFGKALDINSKSAGAYMGLAVVYGQEHEPELAEKNFNKAIRYDTTQESRFQYATWLYNEQRFKESIRQMEVVADDTLYVKRPQAFDILGITNLRVGNAQEAIQNFKKSIVLNQQFVSPRINLANVYASEKDFVKAYEAYNGFVGLVKINLAKQTSATLWLGIQLANVNKDTNAEASYSLQLEQLFPDSREYQAYRMWKKQ
ncbi:hypothetical protein [Gynuella sp.]|uniref:hypothetical protein n=1 Tax=Gynuella sp. TaxID=2969146 RepID=UPI003D09A58A